MRYTFETSNRNGKQSINVSISLIGGFSASASHIIEKHDEQPTWDEHIIEVLGNLIDNMRLTVKERTEALEDAKNFVDYLLNTNYETDEPEKELILEDTMTNELLIKQQENEEKISDDELINAK